MNNHSNTVVLSLRDALSQGPPPKGNLAVAVFSRPSVTVELYSPVGSDPQAPHPRDELYFVAQGRGLFWDGTAKRDVEAGTFVFVGAGQSHRFESFSSDFAVWVVFYGPEGGDPKELKVTSRENYIEADR